jgi:hypothetical protein
MTNGILNGLVIVLESEEPEELSELPSCRIPSSVECTGMLVSG